MSPKHYIIALMLVYMLCYVIYRGPASGTRGEVVLLFEDNPLSKVGIRFDKPIPDGVDLGGICKGNGFFCNGMNSVINSSIDLYLCFFFFFFRSMHM